MINDFLQDRIEKEIKKKNLQFAMKYLSPFLILLLIDILFVLYLLNYSINDIISFANKYSVFLLILINCTTFYYNFKKNRRDRINFLKECTAKLKIYIDASVHNKDVILKCQVENISKVDFSLKNCYVYIDSGKYNIQSKEYEFPFLQNRNFNVSQKSESDCIASFYCKNKICHYPENLTTTSNQKTSFTCGCYNLNHLSQESLAYIGSNECFNQEIVVHLEKGIYRAILVAIPDENCDCKCYSVCFIVD